MSDIFLSYSSVDRAAADVVQRVLTERGYDVFWDQEVPAGQDWDGWIRGRLSGCKLCVVLWSRKSMASPNVRHEAMIAHGANKLLPAMLEEIKPEEFPMGLYLVQALQLQDWRHSDEGLARLVAQVDARMGRDGAEPFKLKRRNPLPVVAAAAAAAIALITAGAGAAFWPSSPFYVGHRTPANVAQPSSAIAPSSQPVAPVSADARHMPAGDIFESCDECPKMKKIPAGVFMMGSARGEICPAGDGEMSLRDEKCGASSELPQREVQIRAFAIGIHEVTFDNWLACQMDGGCGDRTPNDGGFGKKSRPVMNVTWADTQQYVAWLSRKSGGMKYRLPTEAEWEYAARAGTRAGPFYWSGDVARACEFGNSHDATSQNTYGWDRRSVPCSDGSAGPTPVGTFKPNAFGLHDMFGNMSEWVQDCLTPTGDYRGAPRDGSAYEYPDCPYRMVRGGSWWGRSQWARIATREKETAPNYGDQGMGFRVAMDLPPEN